MNEFIEKLIGRLEEEKAIHTKFYRLSEYRELPEIETRHKLIMHNLNKTIEIVNQLAEEYNNGWIPCSERLPEDIIKDCLVTLESGAVFQASYSGISHEFRMICWHGLEYFSDENKVIAWQPLPQPYQPKGE